LITSETIKFDSEGESFCGHHLDFVLLGTSQLIQIQCTTKVAPAGNAGATFVICAPWSITFQYLTINNLVYENKCV
jgi:hypothetical protein